MEHNHSEEANNENVKPLVVLIVGVFLASIAMQFTSPMIGLGVWMRDFMGLFLVVFALLKLIDIPGFKASFRKYDLLAIKVPVYASIYPFLEFALGLMQFAKFWPFFTNLVTFLVMLEGLISVIIALRQGKNLRCACVGATLNLPLSKLTVAENALMAGMAFIMLL